MAPLKKYLALNGLALRLPSKETPRPCCERWFTLIVKPCALCLSYYLQGCVCHSYGSNHAQSLCERGRGYAQRRDICDNLSRPPPPKLLETAFSFYEAAGRHVLPESLSTLITA
jgi:hypothetical protein